MKNHKKNTLFSLRILLMVMMAIWTGCQSGAERNTPADTYVVMLSMDGFRWDYAERVHTPALDYIAGKGVMAEYVIPAFPTKTFPNHYSMATGLYPDNHGIVNNNFYCRELDMSYRIGDRSAVENGAFYAGEPVWVTAELQGITAASFFWVGSEAPVKGVQPTYWKQYQHNFPYENRIDTVIYWLNLPEEQRPRLITFYFNEPDSQGHATGPESPEVDAMVVRVDSLVGVLLQGLKALPIYEKLNLIVTSDHGMGSISTERYINLSEYVDRDWFDYVHGGNPVFILQPKADKLEEVYEILGGIPHLSVWYTHEIPERLNYGRNPRTLDLMVMADSAWSVGWRPPDASRYGVGGTHGWDNAQKDMHTIFYAMGPAFKSNHRQPAFEVVDLYPLITHIMGLQAAEVDGKLERVAGMLAK